MASKRRIRRKMLRNGCQKKRAHPTEEAAQAVVWKTLRMNKKNPGHERAGYLMPYRCEFCGQWHIGNSKGATAIPHFIDKVMARDRSSEDPAS